MWGQQGVSDGKQQLHPRGWGLGPIHSGPGVTVPVREGLRALGVPSPFLTLREGSRWSGRG